MERLRDDLVEVAIHLLETGGSPGTATYLGNLAACITEKLYTEQVEHLTIPPRKGENGFIRFYYR